MRGINYQDLNSDESSNEDEDGIRTVADDQDLTQLFEDRLRKHKRRKLSKRAGGGVTKATALQLVSAAQNH